MFERPHHQRIAKVLQAFDRGVLERAECFFGGATAIALGLGEYRESLDIDFLCASSEGYRFLRNTVSEELGALLRQPVRHLRAVRADRYGIRTVLEMDGVPIKVELVIEARIRIGGQFDPLFGVPTLARVDMYAEKLLANADRGLDKAVLSRDIIDLAMMIDGWGAIPTVAWEKAYAAYGDHVLRYFDKAIELIGDSTYLAGCLSKMQMKAGLIERIQEVLLKAPRWPVDAGS